MVPPPPSLTNKLNYSKNHPSHDGQTYQLFLKLIYPLNDIYDLPADALSLLGNSVHEFSMKRHEMLKSKVAPTYKSLICHESKPITTMLFGYELHQSIRNNDLSGQANDC